MIDSGGYAVCTLSAPEPSNLQEIKSDLFHIPKTNSREFSVLQFSLKHNGMARNLQPYQWTVLLHARVKRDWSDTRVNSCMLLPVRTRSLPSSVFANHH